VEKVLRSGVFLECPNKKKAAEEEVTPKKRAGKGAAKNVAPAESAVVCSYSKRIGDAPPLPTAATHGPVPEKESAKTDEKAADKPVEKKVTKKGGKKALQRA
jgi:DNA topoisomerase-1